MMSPTVMRELLRRVECAQGCIDRRVGAYWRPTAEAADDAREHLEHVRLVLVGAIATNEYTAGRDVREIR